MIDIVLYLTGIDDFDCFLIDNSNYSHEKIINILKQKEWFDQ